jgi:two-component system sensor histidine kinase/response regulator
MGLLANLKLRRKLLVAMLPLALMAIVAGVYSSIQSQVIDTWYSSLIDHYFKTFQKVTAARGDTMRFRLLLYQLVAEDNPDRMREDDGELDRVQADYRALLADALRQSPGRANQIQAAMALFEQGTSSARVVRDAALAGNREKAMNVMRGDIDAHLQQARQAMTDIVDEMQRSANQESDDLTRRTHRAILITWLVIGIGLAASVAAAYYIVQTGVVQKLLSLRGSIKDLADGKLDLPVPYIEHGNEIGEISRALQTLQGVAKEQNVQTWIKSETAATVLRLQSSADFAAFSTSLFSRISESIPLLCAAFYLADEPCTRLTCVGGFALGGPGQIREFALGQGLVGQTAVELRPLVIPINEDHRFRVSAGMGSVTPSSLLFLPLINQDVLIGVLQMATPSPISDRQQALLDALLPVVAMNARMLSGNIKTRELLEQTRAHGQTSATSESNS